MLLPNCYRSLLPLMLIKAKAQATAHTIMCIHGSVHLASQGPTHVIARPMVRPTVATARCRNMLEPSLSRNAHEAVFNNAIAREQDLWISPVSDKGKLDAAGVVPVDVGSVP